MREGITMNSKTDIRTFLIDVIKANTESEMQLQEDDFERDMGEIQINSVEFVKIVVVVEDELDTEFDSNELKVSSWGSLNDFVDFIAQKVGIN